MKGPSFHGPWCHLEDAERKGGTTLDNNIVREGICADIKACVGTCVCSLCSEKKKSYFMSINCV